MESKRQAESKKDMPHLSADSLIFPDLRESGKALEKSLDELEKLVKLFKSELNKPLPFDISSRLINGVPEK
jgi:hypothetical protein